MIKNLLFDLGGVIIDIERMNCVRAFERLGLPDAESFFGDYVQKGAFAALESGEIGAEAFRAELRRLIGRHVSDAEIDAAFCKFLTGLPVSRLEALRQLRKHYGVYVLSNTNPIMWHSRIKQLFEQEGREREDYFDGIVTSFEAKTMKPSAAIFDYTQKHLNIKPEETLFLDDSKANISAAEALGWRGAHVPPGTEFITILQHLNLCPQANDLA